MTTAQTDEWEFQVDLWKERIAENLSSILQLATLQPDEIIPVTVEALKMENQMWERLIAKAAAKLQRYALKINGQTFGSARYD